MNKQGNIDPGVWARVEGYARMLFRKDTPWTVKATLIAAIIYLISPFDLIPDWIVGFGLIDDLTVVSILIGLAIRLASENKTDSETKS